jgi:hypothetical protein
MGSPIWADDTALMGFRDHDITVGAGGAQISAFCRPSIGSAWVVLV